MRILLIAIVFSISLASCLEAGVQSIHTTVICPGSRPSISASFEQTRSSSPEPQNCLFLNLIGDPTPQDQSDWQAKMAAVQAITLTPHTTTRVTGGLRIDLIDSKGLVRALNWRTSTGVITQTALFDESARILRLDRWRNQATVPDAKLAPLACGNSTEVAMGIRGFPSGRTGDPVAEADQLIRLADATTDYALVHGQGLSTTASAPLPPPKTAEAAAHAASLRPGSAKAGATLVLDKPLIVVPNPASLNATMFYQLSADAKVRIAIFDLTGRELRRYDQGEQNAGLYQLPLDIRGYENGIYLATLVIDEGIGATPRSTFKFAVKR